MQKQEDKIIDKYQFLEHRHEQERRHLSRNSFQGRMIKSLLTVEVNTTELCNRKCVFCPRFDEAVYPNRNLNMSVEGAELIAGRLADVDYMGKVSFSGFSENFLNKKFIDIVRVFREKLPNANLESNTNGDQLTEQVITEVFAAGLNNLYINLYDGLEQVEKYEKIIPNRLSEHVKFRAHWTDDDHGLILNNRSGKITWLGQDEKAIEKLKGQKCYYPFYKMFVDWNGDVLFCSNDWGKERVIGNLIQNSLSDVWFSKAMTSIRKKLAKGDRSLSPCNSCNVDGTLFGEQSFEIINENL
ncbi:SPASM domain-containing protein [Planktomarina temperata]|nr:SPASM domain-containing protein [Planktomarina temperata]